MGNTGVSPEPVSYTHLDVYKRQGFQHSLVGVQEVIQAEDFQRNKRGEMEVPHGVQNLSLIHI